MKHLLSFGHGYSARAAAAALRSSGWHITGTTRTPQKLETLRDGGTEAVLWPGADDTPPDALSIASHLLISAAPDAEGDPVLRRHADAIIARAGSPPWRVKISR